MSTTTTSLTTTLVAPAMKGAISEKQCPMCWGEGFPNGSGAQDRIQELEGQVHALTRALQLQPPNSASTKKKSDIYAPPNPKDPTTPHEAAPHWADLLPKPSIRHRNAQHPQNPNPNHKHTRAVSQT
ncbi:hypothetical protein N7489_000481 [Penicillium chrysogenum]|uniref:uncharacterized protein n=1 Tax=Penicillium chrysogenum TaxID=5076 RepID=UPI0024DF1393|nr:uncharacterized protein N7489_000481 [Penicillium chrysogenum]KAJ5250071.1 hypothetical protein N7489_000481 [Penicillium chrysogenum]